MTESKLEESIERIVATFTEIPKISFKRDFAEALTAFAEAVSAKASEVRENQNGECVMCRRAAAIYCVVCAMGEKASEPQESTIDPGFNQKPSEPPCDHNGKHLGQRCPELAKQMTMEQAAKITLGKTEPKECLHQGFYTVDGVVRLCRLCNKYLGLTYPPKGPKECSACGCREVSHPKYNCKEFEPPADLPAEVQKEIERLAKEGKSRMDHGCLKDELERFARLCLSVAGRGRG